MSLVVTGASGNFARGVTELLLTRVPPSELILVTRNPSSLEHLKSRGVRVRYGNFDEPQSLEEAFAGGSRMLLISTLSVGRRLEQHRRAIDAATAAGVAHIVYTSSAGVHPRSPALVISDHLATEEVLRRCGAAYTILRDAQYAEVISTMLAPQALAAGKWLASAGDGCMGFVSKKDCVAAAAGVLTSPGHEGATYEITGPQLLSFRDAAALAAEIGGKPIEYIVVSDEERQAMWDALGVPRTYVEGMENRGKSAWSSDDMVSYERAMRAGYFAICSHHVKLITGQPAQSLRDVLLAARPALLAAARS